MPIYEYECTRCSHHFDSLQKISDTPLTECPACHKASLKRLVSPAGFQLKGTGWYVTDFKDKQPSQKSDNADTPTADASKTNASKTQKATASQEASKASPKSDTEK